MKTYKLEKPNTSFTVGVCGTACSLQYSSCGRCDIAGTHGRPLWTTTQMPMSYKTKSRHLPIHTAPSRWRAAVHGRVGIMFTEHIMVVKPLPGHTFGYGCVVGLYVMMMCWMVRAVLVCIMLIHMIHNITHCMIQQLTNISTTPTPPQPHTTSTTHQTTHEHFVGCVCCVC